MGTRPCEAESSGSGSRSSCPQIPRYFSPLGRSCGALSACMGILRRSRLVVSWIRSGGEPNGYDLCTPIAELNPPLPGWGEYYKRAHVRKLFQSLDGWEVRGVRWKVWRADPKLPLQSDSEAAFASSFLSCPHRHRPILRCAFPSGERYGFILFRWNDAIG